MLGGEREDHPGREPLVQRQIKKRWLTLVLPTKYPTDILYHIEQ